MQLRTQARIKATCTFLPEHLYNCNLRNQLRLTLTTTIKRVYAQKKVIMRLTDFACDHKPKFVFHVGVTEASMCGHRT